MGDAPFSESGPRLHAWFSNWISRGGIGRYLHHLVANFAQTRATIDEPYNPALGARAPASLRVVSVPAFRPARIRFALNDALNEFSSRRDRPDVLHVAHHPAPEWVWRTRRRGVKVVYTVYDLIPELLIHPGRLIPERRALLESADHIIAISQSTANDLCEIYNVPPERVTVVPLATHLRAPAEAKPAGRPYFLVVGNRGGYKNFNLTIEAFAILAPTHPQADLLCAGPGFSDDERKKFATLGLGSRVLLREQPDDEALAAAYAGASACLVPSTYEGFGLPVLEAMACGAPVVTLPLASLPEVAGNAALYASEQPEIFAAAMRRILEEPDLAKKLRRAGRAQAERFSWACTAHETETVYRRLVSGGN